MSEEEKEQEEIKIVDKRRFSTDGARRSAEDGAAEERASESAPEEKSAKVVKNNVSENSVEKPDASVVDSHTGEVEVDFASFVMSLGTQALMMLGKIPNPENGQVVVHIEAARQTIEILAMLEEKTAGNLSDEETRLMAELLASLRMTYVDEKRNHAAK